MAEFTVTDGGSVQDASDGVLTLIEALAFSRATTEGDVIRFAPGITEVDLPLNFEVQGELTVIGDTNGDGFADVTLRPGSAGGRLLFTQADGASGAEEDLAALTLQDIRLAEINPLISGRAGDGGRRSGSDLDGSDGDDGGGFGSIAAIINTIDLTLSGVVIDDVVTDATGFTPGRGAPGEDGFDGADGRFQAIDGREIFFPGERGGNGGNGGDGGDGMGAELLRNEGTLTLIDTVFGSGNRVLPGGGGAGGDGGNGGNGGEAFPTDPGARAGPGGFGGSGGAGGDAGSTIMGVIDADGASTTLVGDLVVNGESASGGSQVSGAPGGRAGINGISGDGTSPTGFTPEVGLFGEAEEAIGLVSATGSVTDPTADFILYARPVTVSAEEGGSLTFSVIRAGSVASAATVTWTLSGDGITEDDFVGGLSGEASFVAGGSNLQTVTIETADDGVLEGDEDLVFTLSDAAVPSDSSLRPGLGTTEVAATILDGPERPVVEEPPTDGGGDGGDGSGSGDGSGDGSGGDGSGDGSGGAGSGDGSGGDGSGDGSGGGSGGDGAGDGSSGDGDGGSAFPPGALVGTDGPNRLRGDQVEGDAIFGLGGNDRLLGRGGDDQVDGGDEDDLLLGGPGEDTLDGGGGEDSLAGGSGDDTLTGGEGNDYFALVQGELDGIDTVTDFQDGDKIAIDDRLVGLGSGRVEVRDMTFADALVILDLNIFGLSIGDEDTTIFYDADGLGGPGGFAPVMVLEGVTERLAIDDFALF